MKKFLPLFLISVFWFLFSVGWVRAEECNTSCSDSSLDKCIAECNKLLDISMAATRPHEQKMEELQAIVDSTEADINTLTILIGRKRDQVAAQEQKLAGEQDKLNTKIRNFYEKSYSFDINYLFSLLFSGSNAGDVVRNFSYWQNFISRGKQEIVNTATQLVDLNNSRQKLEDQQTQLAAKKKILEATLAPIKDLVNRAKAYQSQLSATAGALSARQQALIAARLGSLNLSRSAGIAMACVDDRNIDPHFSPRFAFYTFGIPHRVGMSQFGAYGRASAGQGYEKILRAYYNFDSLQKFDSNTKIKVQGYGEYSLEDYTKRIYEVPESWPIDALRAQAIAARSYALRYVSDKRDAGLPDEICTSQDCQVFKPDPKTGQWDQAVRDTEGLVMMQGGKPIKAWFSSTDGGYTLSSGEHGWSDTPWTKHTRDTTGDVNSISDLQSKAYDRGSPCFYNAQGWRAEYNKSAWLKPEEVADIVNVIMVSAYTSDWDSWDVGRVKSELQSHGKQPFNRVTDVSMSFDFGWGKTTLVTVSGDAPTQTFDGTTFKNYFNVRAPANIAIVGPLYNIEKR